MLLLFRGTIREKLVNSMLLLFKKATRVKKTIRKKLANSIKK